MPKKKSRGAGSRGVRAKKSSSVSHHVIPFGVLIILLIGITVIIVLLASLKTTYQSALRQRCKGEKITPGQINECLALGCSFDVTVCPAPCPIGFQTDKKGCVISCECAVEGRFQGDIHFDEDSLETIISMISDPPLETEFSIQAGGSYPDDHIRNNLWDEYTANGRHKVPYECADDLNIVLTTVPEAKQVMKEVAKSISDRSCIDFVPRMTEKYYVHLTSEEGCWADVGMYTKDHPSGRKFKLNLAKYCVFGVALHEAMHVLGFPHEHNRFDRDGYVEIRLENVRKGMKHNFEKCTENQDISRIVKYSDASIMHYTGYSFSATEEPTIVIRATGVIPYIYALDFTPDDLYKVLEAYKCPLKRSRGGGTWTGWTSWSECIGSSKDRWKICENREKKPSADCYITAGPVKESKTEGCPNIAVSKGHWSQWEAWSACSKTCNGGSATRKRTCSIPGECGDGKTNERKKCSENSCPVKPKSKWSEWGHWSTCSKKCEGGEKTRKRQCFGPNNKLAYTCLPRNGDSETNLCNTMKCEKKPVPPGGGWHKWTLWSGCSRSCGGGKRTRERKCKLKQCNGKSKEEGNCNTKKCEPKWSNWGSWSECTKQCGRGQMTRKRQCLGEGNRPATTCSPSNGGSQIKTCNTKACTTLPPTTLPTTTTLPPGGGWDKWQAWSSCSKTCGSGKRSRLLCITCNLNQSARKRTCKIKQCEGKNVEQENCNTKICPVVAIWSQWEEWTKCSKECGGGQTKRERKCLAGNKASSSCLPKNAGIQTKSCNTYACKTTPVVTTLQTSMTTPLVSVWGNWEPWSDCSDTCGGGEKSRKRTCKIKQCEGKNVEQENCNTKICPVVAIWSQWGEWTKCNKECGGGKTKRERKCLAGNKASSSCFPKNDGIQSKSCNTYACNTTPIVTTLQTSMTTSPVSVWGNWEPWSDCSKTCGGGEKSRKRKCKTGSCGGESTELQKCNKNACPISAKWAQWQAWSKCSKQCDGGKQTRKRQCLDSSKQSVNTCSLKNGESQAQPCNTNKCVEKPISPETGWDNWLLWSSCSHTCNGKRARKRNCKIVQCTGKKEELEECNTDICAGQGSFQVFAMNPVAVAEYLCGSEPGAEWYFGDFNGDARMDLLCSSKNDFFKLSHADESGAMNSIVWKGHLAGCTGTLKYVGDFNGDGREDLLCKDIDARKLSVKIMTDKGLFSDQTVYAGYFCTQKTETLFVLDSDGNGKADIVCRHPDSSIEIKLNKY